MTAQCVVGIRGDLLRLANSYCYLLPLGPDSHDLLPSFTMTDIFSLKGSNAAITGAAGQALPPRFICLVYSPHAQRDRAIGTQTAIRFAKAGASTLLLSDISQDALDTLSQTLKLHEPFPDCRFIFHICDVSDDEQVAGLLARLDKFGGVDRALI